MFFDIYSNTYLKDIKNYNQLNYIKNLILENKQSLLKSITSIKLINSLLFNKNNLIIEEDENQAIRDVTDTIKPTEKVQKQTESFNELKKLIDEFNSFLNDNQYTINLSPATMRKLKNVIFNANKEIELNKRLETKLINDAKIHAAYINILNYLNGKRDSDSFKKLWDKYKSFFQQVIRNLDTVPKPKPKNEIIDEIRCKKFNEYFENDYENKLNDLFNNKNNLNILIKSFKTKSKNIEETEETDELDPKLNILINTILLDYESDLVSLFIQYYDALQNFDSSNFYPDNGKHKRFLIKELYTIITHDQDEKNQQDFNNLCEKLYNLTMNNSASSGKGEVMLSLILPHAFKSNSTGDIYINKNSGEIKAICKNSKGKDVNALINGKSDYSINSTKNKNFINTIFNRFKILLQSYAEKLSENDKKELNIKIKDPNFKIQYVKSTDKESGTKIEKEDLPKYNINKFNLKDNNNNNAFVDLIKYTYNIYQKTLLTGASLTFGAPLAPGGASLAFESTNSVNDFKNELINIFTEGFQQLYTDESHDKIKNFVESLIESLGTDFENPNTRSWPNLIGIFQLKYYLAHEKSKYFICCISTNDGFAIDIFDKDYNFDDIIELGYSFAAPEYGDNTSVASKIQYKRK